MNRIRYQRILQPAIDLMIDHLIDMEAKHGEGVFLQDDDLLKATGHCLSAYRGLVNEDGSTHSVAAGVRVIKGILAEIE